MNNNNNENLESELQPANKSQYGSKLKTQNKTKIETQNPVTKEKKWKRWVWPAPARTRTLEVEIPACKAILPGLSEQEEERKIYLVFWIGGEGIDQPTQTK